MGMGAGAFGAGGTAAVGLANITAITSNSTRSWIASGVSVTGLGNEDAISVYTGTRDKSDNDIMDTEFKGVAVTATSSEFMVGITVSGQGGGTAGVAGSATVSVVNETTSARIHKGALINTLDTGSAGSEQGVRVTAADLTRVIDAAGGLGGGGAAGIGAGVDVGVLTKTRWPASMTALLPVTGQP